MQSMYLMSVVRGARRTNESIDGRAGGQVGRRAIRRLSQRDDGQTTIRNTTFCQQLGRRGEVLTRLVVVSDNSYNPRAGDIERRRPSAWQQRGSIPASQHHSGLKERRTATQGANQVPMRASPPIRQQGLSMDGGFPWAARGQL